MNESHDNSMYGRDWGTLKPDPAQRHTIRFGGENGALVAEIDTVTGEITLGDMYTPESAGREAAEIFWKVFAGNVMEMKSTA